MMNYRDFLISKIMVMDSLDMIWITDETMKMTFSEVALPEISLAVDLICTWSLVRMYAYSSTFDKGHS